MNSIIEKDSIVRGHDIYKIYCMLVVQKELTLATGDGNKHDEHTVTVMKDGYVVRHCWTHPMFIVQGAWHQFGTQAILAS